MFSMQEEERDFLNDMKDYESFLGLSLQKIDKDEPNKPYAYCNSEATQFYQ